MEMLLKEGIDMQERRRFIRVPESSQITYEILPGAKRDNFLSADISEAGIRFFVHKFIPKNSLLKIKFTLQKISFCFEAIVKLKWIREDIPEERYDIGTEFVNIPQKTSDRLVDYVREYRKIY